MKMEERLQKLECRSKEADMALKQLHICLEVLNQRSQKDTLSQQKSSAVLQLEQENIRLTKEVESLKQKLIEAELRNGIFQIPNPQFISSDSSDVTTPSSKTLVTTVPPKDVPPDTAKGTKGSTEVTEKQSKPKKEKQSQAAATGEKTVDVSRLDFRVGRIISVRNHPDADTLYVEEIELGEERPRTVCSGLVKHIPLEQMQERMVIVLCNLKPAKMRGVLSEAMVMCASTPEKVEILDPPTGSVPGDRVIVEGYTGTPDAQLNPKKKIFEQVQPELLTNDEGVATYRGVPFIVPSKGICRSQTLKNTIIK